MLFGLILLALTYQPHILVRELTSDISAQIQAENILPLDGVAAISNLDENLIGKLDRAVVNGNSIVYSYYSDVIGDVHVLIGADVYCGGSGRAVIQLSRGDKGGREYNSMAFTCR